MALLSEVEKIGEQQKVEREEKRAGLLDNPFDPRTEISADAKHIASKIVFHLWILFVLLPLAMGLVLYLVLPSSPN